MCQDSRYTPINSSVWLFSCTGQFRCISLCTGFISVLRTVVGSSVQFSVSCLLTLVFCHDYR